MITFEQALEKNRIYNTVAEHYRNIPMAIKKWKSANFDNFPSYVTKCYKTIFYNEINKGEMDEEALWHLEQIFIGTIIENRNKTIPKDLKIKHKIKDYSLSSDFKS
jgi:hypothetical protein